MLLCIGTSLSSWIVAEVSKPVESMLFDRLEAYPTYACSLMNSAVSSTALSWCIKKLCSAGTV